MIAPVCVQCNVEMGLFRTRQAVVDDGGLFHGDTFKCPECGLSVVACFGRKPIREVSSPDFRAVLSLEAAYGPVIDLRKKQETSE